MTTTLPLDQVATASEQPLVLVVEDNEKNARMMIAMLSGAGFRTHVAIDGLQGQRCAQELRPAIIITDLQMPGMDGMTMTRALRDNPLTAGIPVIATSAHALNEHREAALAAGCCSFISKPFRLQTLLSEVANAMAAQFAGV
jgi:CheY-like chemotaxis protein